MDDLLSFDGSLDDMWTNDENVSVPIDVDSLPDNLPSESANMARKKPNTQPIPSGKRKNSSNVWDHFTKLEGPEARSQCMHCGRILKSHSTKHGTSSMKNHLTRCMKYPNANLEKNQTTISDFSAKEGSGSSLLVGSKKTTLDIEFIRSKLAAWLIIDELPFRTVEGKGFRELIVALEPRFVVPSRVTVARDCFKLYDLQKKKLKTLMSGLRISFTTDCWTSIQNLSYLTLTAHFIDANWIIQKRILNFCLLESHKGEAIGRCVESCLMGWGFDKVLTITVDNASSNNTAIEYLQDCSWGDPILGNKYLHVRCSAHIVNLIVKEGLKEHLKCVMRIRNVVKFVRSSPQRLKNFDECVAIEKIQCKKKVCLDVETRWNATYMMLETAVNYKKAFDRLRRDDIGYMPYFNGGYGEAIADSELDNLRRDVLIGPPQNDDWEKAEAFVKFLQLFYESTLVFYGSNYVTVGVFFEQLVLMHFTIKKLQSQNDVVLRTMASSMRQKFEKYWVDAKIKNNLLFFGVVFDPRFKFTHVEFCFEQIYSEDVVENGILITKISDKGEKLIKDIKEELNCLFKVYMDKYGVGISDETSTVSTSVACDSDDTKAFLKSQFKLRLQKGKTSVDSKSELTRYLSEACEEDDNLDVLQWWKLSAFRYPVLSKMAREILAIPVSTVASEQSFSTGGRVLTEFRSSLKPKTVEMLVCGQNWLRNDNDPIDIREIMDDIEDMEKIGEEVLSASSSVGSS